MDEGLESETLQLLFFIFLLFLFMLLLKGFLIFPLFFLFCLSAPAQLLHHVVGAEPHGEPS